MKKQLIILFVSFFISTILLGQKFKGMVKGEKNESVVGAVVLLQNSNLVNIATTTTNDDGIFFLDSVPRQGESIVVQHMSYIPVKKEIGSMNCNTITIKLESRMEELAEVVIKADIPSVKILGNKLIYNPKDIIKRYAPNTAYDILLNTPGIVGNSENISLVGANRFMVVINGKKTFKNQEQVYSVLQNLHPNEIKNIEVLYNAPSKYGINGAVINVITKKKKEKNLSNLIKVQGSSSPKVSWEGAGSLLFNNKNISIFSGIGIKKDNKIEDTRYELFDDYSFDNLFLVRDLEKNSSDSKYNFTLGLAYNINESNHITLDYYGAKSKNEKYINTEILNNDNSRKKSLSKELTKSTLHNLNFQVDLSKGVLLNIKYMYFNSPFNQRYAATHLLNKAVELPSSYNQESNLKINNFDVGIEKQISISKATKVNIGVDYQKNRSLTNISDASVVVDKNKQIENISALYTEVYFKLWNSLSLTLGGRIEHTKSIRENLITNNKLPLWSETSIFPKVTISLPIHKSNLLQLNLTSEKKYPAFWAMNPRTTIIDENTISVGNPNIKPSREYDARLMFIIKRKYFFFIGSTYTPNYFANIPHFDSDTKKTIFKYENYKYSLFNNFSFFTPFSLGQNFNSRLSLHALRMQDKMEDFYGSNFNNNRWVFSLSSNNSYVIPFLQKGKLIAEVDFRYQSPAIQGIYKLNETYSLNSKLKWVINSDLTIQVGANNILGQSTPKKMKIETVGQESIRYPYNRKILYFDLMLSLGKKNKYKYRKVNTSRIGRNN